VFPQEKDRDKKKKKKDRKKELKREGGKNKQGGGKKKKKYETQEGQDQKSRRNPAIKGAFRVAAKA